MESSGTLASSHFSYRLLTDHLHTVTISLKIALEQEFETFFPCSFLAEGFLRIVSR